MIELRLLGELQIERGGRLVEPFSSDKVTALLIYLVLEPGPHDRSELAQLLWEGLPAGRARANLRHALHKLQQKLPELLDVDRRRVALRSETPLVVDVRQFTRALRAGVDNGSAALALYDGELATGLSVRDGVAFEEWLLRRREAIRLDYLNLLETLAHRAMRRQRWDEAVRLTERQLSVEPLREAAHRRMVELHARLEAYDEALHQYERCRRLLAEELESEPAPETKAWRRGILRLRARPRHNLPAPTTPFIGRDAEVDHLVAVLGDPDGQHVMLFGPGGIGKTRLALAVGQRLRPAFLEGVVFVGLADLADSRGVIARVAGVLARDGFAGPAGASPPAVYLRQTLHERRYLLIVDSGESVARGVAELAEICAEMAKTRLLLTTRRRLPLAGRWTTYQVTGLSRDGEREDENEAVRLFVATARRTAPNFAVSADNLPSIRRIATLTGGMPLALELAASWARMRSCQAIADDLARDLDLMASRRRDILPRQRSVRVVFDSLWQQLREDERELLLRLSVFRTPFTLAAAAAVAGAAENLLEGLSDVGILLRDAGRWRLHPLVRQYVEERLDGAVDNEVRRAHTEHYANQSVAWRERMHGPALRAVLAEIDAVEEELYMALAWAREHGLNETYAQFLDVLGPFFVANGRLIAGFQWVQHEYETAGDDDAENSARRLHLLGVLAQEIGWLERARKYAGDALEKADPQHPSLAARARLTLGTIAYFQGRYDAVADYASRALDHFRAARLLNDEIDALVLLGLCHASLSRHHDGPPGTIRGDHLVRAREYFEEGRRLSVRRENQAGEARCLHNLGYVLYVSHLAKPDGRKLEESLSFFEKSAELLERTGHQPRRARSLNWKGIILSQLRRYEEAEASYLMGLQLATEIGAWVIVTDILHALAAWVDRNLGRTERAALLLARVATHPTTDARIRRWAETYLAEVTAEMDAGRAAGLRRAGAAVPLEELTTKLLAGELTPPFFPEDAR